jgi:hypothetical protein
MYAAVNRDGRIIAIHKKEDVVLSFTEGMDDVNLIKFKRKVESEKFNDLYLIKHRGKYLPQGYLRAINYEADDLYTTYDTLREILESDSVTDKERKWIAKTMVIVDRILDESMESLSDENLDEMEDMRHEYLRKIRDD